MDSTELTSCNNSNTINHRNVGKEFMPNKINNLAPTSVNIHPKDLFYDCEYCFIIKDRKISMIKSRITPAGPIVSGNDLANLITTLILYYRHPTYLPTLDEAIEPIIKNNVMKIIGF